MSLARFRSLRGLATAAVLGLLLTGSPLGQGERVVSLLARQQSPSAAPNTQVFRTSATLVTVDAVVTDKTGRHVTDLTKEDFELVADGKRRTLRHVVYVPLGSAPAVVQQPTQPSVEESRRTMAPPDGRTMTPSPIRAVSPSTARVMAVVVDDLGLSFESTVAVRNSLKKFIDRQVQSGDQVAILRTAGGVGALQQFTADRRLMHAAADRVQWTILSRSGVTAFTPISAEDILGQQTGSGSGTAEEYNEDTIEGLRTTMLAAASLNALEYIISGIEHLPGRKAVVFFSEGFRLMATPEGFHTAGNARVWNAFTKLMNRANLAGVVVYSIDARGLTTGMVTAEDNPQTRGSMVPRGAQGSQQRSGATEAKRHQFLIDSQEALAFMAEQTGGFAVLNNNDLNLGLSRVLNDLSGYYLLGYDASDSEPRGWEPGRVTVRVSRKGLQVRSRRGVFGRVASDAPRASGPSDPLTNAALSPFGASDLAVRLTALFGYDATAGSYVRLLLFVDANGLHFTNGPEGRHDAGLDVLQMAVGDNGMIVGDRRQTLTLSLTDDQLREVRARGIVYSSRLAIKTPGPFQVRAAVREASTQALGSASQFVEVPKVGKGRLALSGLLLRARTDAGTPAESAAAALAQGQDGGLASDALGDPSVRIFEPGSEVVYAYEIYDGRRDAADDRLMMSTALLRDAKVVYENEPTPVNARSANSTVRVIPIAGRLALGHDVPAGTYTLQVTVNQRGGGTKGVARQWIDFDVRR